MIDTVYFKSFRLYVDIFLQTKIDWKMTMVTDDTTFIAVTNTLAEEKE